MGCGPSVSFDPDPGVGFGQVSCVRSDQDPVVWLIGICAFLVGSGSGCRTES